MTKPIPNQLLTRHGILPIRTGPVRFAVGDPNGLTSNSWRVWTTRNHDIYVKCRDNFREVKVSLHETGRWRMGFTEEASASSPNLLQADQDRAWEVWDRPAEHLPDTVIAFKLVFPSRELAVTPEHRKGKVWRNVVFIEAAPSGKVTVVTLFISRSNVAPRHESEPSFALASLKIDDAQNAHLVAHSDPQGNLAEIIESSVLEAWAKTVVAGVDIPASAYAYFHGHQADGCRFFVGARMHRPSVLSANEAFARRERERAYFLWQNRDGLRWWDSDSNWFEALAIERENIAVELANKSLHQIAFSDW